MRHQALLGKLLGMAGQLAREQGANDGFRVVVNNGRVGRQEVYHLHVHVLGGPEPLGSGMNRL
jgi:histidine triad (HIT) family protein